MPKVKFLVSAVSAERSFTVGDIVEVSKEDAEQLVQAQYAELVEESKKTSKSKAK